MKATKQSSLLGFFTKAGPVEKRDGGTRSRRRAAQPAAPSAAPSADAPAQAAIDDPAKVPADAPTKAPVAAAAPARKRRAPPTPATPSTNPAKRTRSSPQSSPTPRTSDQSLTPPPSSDVPDEEVGGRRRAARRLNYYEERSGSSEEDEEDDASQASEDEFVLSDASSEASASDVSAVPSDASDAEPEPEPEPEESDDDVPARNRRVAAPAPATPRALAPSASRSPPSASRPSVALHHLTKAERRVEEDKKRKLENEEAYSFLLDVRDKDMNRPGDLNYDQRTLYIPPSAWRSFTPFEKQFWEVKQNHFDTVLFFQKGKFYELYENDALIGHRECDLKLTDRVKMKMVGVPEASFDLFATKLLALGYKVGRVDQCETAVAKGMRVGEKSRGGGSEIVRRELRHVVTSGTIVDGSVLADDLSSYCVSIKEHRPSPGAPPAFGICTLDASIAEFRWLEVQDDAVLTQLETVLRSLRVREVLLEKGHVSPSTLRLVRNVVPATCQVTLLRAHTEFLAADAAAARLDTLFGDAARPAALAALPAERLATSAVGAMLWYLAQLHLERDLCASGNFARLPPPSERGALVLDAKSLMHLNVLHNDQGTDEGTLHRLLNRCVTPFGRRLFTLWLTAPLADVAAIEARLDAVDDLLAHPAFGEAFAQFARALPDLERLQTRIVAASAARASSLRRARGVCAFVAGDDGSFTPTPGTDAAYDDAEAAVHAAEARLEEERKAAAATLKLALRDVPWKHVGTNEIYQLEVPARTAVPAPWIVMSQTKAAKRYYTPRGKELVRLLKEARETRLAAVRAFQDTVYAQFRAENATFARAVRTRGARCAACRPRLVWRDTAHFAFRALRHPCMAPSALSGAPAEFIPNDLALGDTHEEVMILTGSNMAGKSTTARTAATAVILAQLGCYVPAEDAELAPVDRIASRMGANDQLFRNHSTFMVEMLEASKILRDATPRSLVIMDELGRGTSTFDGQAIAYAVLHHLVARTRCLCFFMTHYATIAQSLDTYPRVCNRHMHVLVDDAARHVVFTYRLVPGIAESSYGTQVARIAGVPDAICTQAAAISARFFAEAHAAQAQRRTRAVPLETLSDFARLVALAHDASAAGRTELALLLAAAQHHLATPAPTAATP
ncbi:MSH6 [Malassezia furfur]|nr:MSH6 [Malassezia furfur]